jgi:hypothetical protein
MKSIEVEKTLEKCDLLRPWQRDEPIKRWHWAIDGYCEGYISKNYLNREQRRFLTTAERLIADQSVLSTLNYLRELQERPLTEAEQKRRQEWLTREALSAARTELQRQRRRLREGHATLTAIRKLLAHGVRSSLQLVSEPETSSPT